MSIHLFKSYRQMTDEELMKRASHGNDAAFEELYRRYARRLQGFFFRQLGGDDEAAADLTHDVFLRAYEAKDNITVFWSNDFGKLTIDASRKGGEGDQYEDTLTIRNGHKSDFNFVKSGAQDLYINGKNGGSIFIDGFYSYDDAMSFTGGISFNGTIYRYSDIVKDLRFKYS